MANTFVVVLATAGLPILLIGLILVGLGYQLVAWQPSNIWIAQFGTQGEVERNAATFVASDRSLVYVGGYVGMNAPANVTPSGLFLARYDSAGSTIWTRVFGNTSKDFMAGLSIDSNQAYVAVHSARGYVRAYDSNGNVSWTTQLTNVSIRALATGPAGIYVGGYASPPSFQGNTSMWVSELDFAGNQVWTRQFGNSADNDLTSIYASSDGVYVCGKISDALPGQSYVGSTDNFVRKYDLNGTELWTREYGTQFIDEAFGITGDGSGIYVTDSTVVPRATENTFVRKFDFNGNTLWSTQLDVPGPSFPSIFASSTGVYVATQATPGSFLYKYDPSGGQVWRLQINASPPPRVQ